MMGMLVSGVSKDILKISTEEFTLYLSGNSENKKFRATNNNKQISATLQISSNYNETKVYTVNYFDDLELKEENTMYPSFFEDGIYKGYDGSNCTDDYVKLEELLTPGSSRFYKGYSDF